MLYQMFVVLDKYVGFQQANAHCDIPCKIYDPFTAQFAALSVIRLMDLITEVEANEPLGTANHAQLARLVNEKEIHAEKVKQEVRVIWGDYCKQPQFDQVENIHSLVHDIMLAGSACKQNIERKQGIALLKLVNQFSEAFWKTKNMETFMAECPYPPNQQVVYPKLG